MPHADRHAMKMHSTSSSSSSSSSSAVPSGTRFFVLVVAFTIRAVVLRSSRRPPSGANIPVAPFYFFSFVEGSAASAVAAAASSSSPPATTTDNGNARRRNRPSVRFWSPSPSSEPNEDDATTSIGQPNEEEEEGKETDPQRRWLFGGRRNRDNKSSEAADASTDEEEEEEGGTSRKPKQGNRRRRKGDQGERNNPTTSSPPPPTGKEEKQTKSNVDNRNKNKDVLEEATTTKKSEGNSQEAKKEEPGFRSLFRRRRSRQDLDDSKNGAAAAATATAEGEVPTTGDRSSSTTNATSTTSRSESEAPRPPPPEEDADARTEGGRGGDETNTTATATASTGDGSSGGGGGTNGTASALPGVSSGMPPSGSMIIIGSPGGPQRIYRRPVSSSPGGILIPADPSQQQRSPPQQHPSQMSQNSMLIVELVASVLSTLTRLWLIRWVTTWISQQEESIQPTQHFVFERLNDRYVRDASALQTVVAAPPEGVSLQKWKRQHVRRLGKRPKPPSDVTDMFRRTVVVVELNTDTKGGPDNEYLSDIVSFLLQQHRSHAFGTDRDTSRPLDLEVVWLVTSPGGSVSSFGLAAAQVRRLSRQDGIATTVCVDKYAASGGYMIASQAHRLLAAPFASVGSVGVIMEGLNFHELARKYGVQPLVLKAGDSKNPFTTFGPISQKELRIEQERLEKVHDAFRQLIVEGRPSLHDKLQQVADGSVYLGTEALDLQMVDRVSTSSEYIMERVEAGDRVLQLHRANPIRFGNRRPGTILHPIDILPHLRSWITAKFMGGGNQHNSDQAFAHEAVVSWLVRTGGWIGLLHHVYTQYIGNGNHRR